MKEIARVDEPAEAHLIGGFLESHGIPVRIVGDQPFWADGTFVPKDMKPTIFVPEEFEAKARELLLEIEAQRTQGETWFCGKCGDVFTAAYTECPVCGEVRPPAKPRVSTDG